MACVDISVAQAQQRPARRYVGNSTIGERWNADTTPPYPFDATDRWAIAAKALKVQTVHYKFQDQIADVSTKLTPSILKSLGDTYTTAITPTILFAREEYFRSAGLNASLGPAPPGS